MIKVLWLENERIEENCKEKWNMINLNENINLRILDYKRIWIGNIFWGWIENKFKTIIDNKEIKLIENKEEIKLVNNENDLSVNNKFIYIIENSNNDDYYNNSIKNKVIDDNSILLDSCASILMISN